MKVFKVIKGSFMSEGLSFKSIALLGYMIVAPLLHSVFGNLLNIISKLDMLCFTKYHNLGSGQLHPDPVSSSCIKILTLDF